MIIADGNVWRIELTIGTKHGYEGPEVVTPGHVIEMVQAFFKETKEEVFSTVVWTRGTMLGPWYDQETVIRVGIENNPMHTPNVIDQDVLAYAARLSQYLGTRLNQKRIYASVYPIRSVMFEYE